MFAASLLGGIASAATVDFDCVRLDETGAGPGDAIGIVGLPPLTIQCDSVLPLQGIWDQVSWTFGDGNLVVGESASFTYDEVGQYAVSVQLDGYEDPANPDAVTPQNVRTGYVTVCGPPEPEFSWRNKGGLKFALTNESEPAPYCLTHSKWEVYRGRGVQGKPAMTFATWDTRFELPSEGPWTIALVQDGLAGTAVAVHTIQARYQLTDDLTHMSVLACSTSGGAAPGGVASAFVLLAALVRRRRA